MPSAINISKIMFYSKFSAFRICAVHGACNEKNIFALKFQKFMAQVQAQTTKKNITKKKQQQEQQQKRQQACRRRIKIKNTNKLKQNCKKNGPKKRRSKTRRGL